MIWFPGILFRIQNTARLFQISEQGVMNEETKNTNGESLSRIAQEPEKYKCTQ